MSYKGDKEMKRVEGDPKLRGRSDYNNNVTLQTGTLQPRLGRRTTMEGIGGTYELVSGVGFVLVEEASTSSTLQVHGEQATSPPLEQAVLPPLKQAALPLVEDILKEEVGDSAPVADPEGIYDYRCPRSGKMERTYILSQRDQYCPVRGCPVVTRGAKRHVLGGTSILHVCPYTRATSHEGSRFPSVQGTYGDGSCPVAQWSDLRYP
ncbi:unnamed protein product [Mytilus coruscus]|uniref:Uncharacterized protein n=1 Tax=Mytilus coruscus TaxID=42192 RepID=A0A6J8A3C5_MYTCO|nr:unnamed protein product [Mytilus coruscus]